MKYKEIEEIYLKIATLHQIRIKSNMLKSLFLLEKIY